MNAAFAIARRRAEQVRKSSAPIKKVSMVLPATIKQQEQKTPLQRCDNSSAGKFKRCEHYE